MNNENENNVDSQDDAGQIKKKSRRKRFLRILGMILIFAGIAVIGYPASTFLVTKKAQDGLRSDWDKIVKETAKNVSTNSKDLNNTLQEQEDHGNKPSDNNKIPAGKAAFRLIIPKINIDRIAVKGIDRASLKLGPGHMNNTVWPGESGVCVVSGHRTTYGAPFFRLDRLENGDEIIVETPTSRYVYTVYDVKAISPNNTSFIKKTGDSVIALTTCTPIYSARQRLLVLGKLQN